MPERPHMPNDYPYIRAYVRIMNFGQVFLRDELIRARADKAPADAVSWKLQEGGIRRLWRTLSHLDASAETGNMASKRLAERLREEAEAMA